MSHAAPEGRKFPPRLIPIINEKNSGTDEKAKPSLDTGAINVVIIGIKINAVGVFATTPEIKLIIISIIKDKIKGFNFKRDHSKNLSKSSHSKTSNDYIQ
ncbi:hypothetical protein LCGC14_1801960 [marine sediment metagenome]|uniref:Uncharacterized protein n=1 Tax=marine sediment metagenome TaxID=412755 RepID=A0A0F9J418_9ZZZZ